MNQMSDLDPYTTPTTSNPVSEVDTSNGEVELATLNERFTGSVVDGLILVIPLLPFMFFLGFFNNPEGMDFGKTALFGIIGFGLHALINYRFLSQTGQTIGKKVAKTKIVDAVTGEKPDIKSLLLKRQGFQQVLGIVPVISMILTLIDLCFIFRKDRRCIHDFVANTKVIKAR